MIGGFSIMSEQKPPAPTPHAVKNLPGGSPREKGRGWRYSLLLIVVIVAASGLYISFLRYHGLHASAALYVGLPLLLAYVFIMTGKSATATGSILKGMSIALLLSAPILQEGFICILMAAPIFYLVGAIIGVLIDRRGKGRLQTTPVAVFLVLLSLEGTHDALTFDRDYSVRAEKIISASPESIATQLAQPMHDDARKPWLLRIFPSPAWNTNEGSAPGDRRQMHFVYYRHFFTNARIGDLIFEVSERGDNYITSRLVHDDSYLSTYLQWQSSTVRWQAVDDKHTRVVWEIRYRRKLDPAWYFGPLEYYAVKLAAGNLIDIAATPPAGEG